MTSIYVITWINNSYFYIGQSKDFYVRKRSHLSRLKNRKHKNKKLQNVFNKYGEPQFHIIEECSIEELDEREQFYLDLLFDEPNCLNILSNVEAGTRGRKLSEEHKKKLRQNHKGMKGKNHSKETRVKMSEAQKGRNLGIKLSEETKKKMSEAHKRRKGNKS